MYTGKLPVGKHNYSKIISLADSLQMFGVAVSCKNLLASLRKLALSGSGSEDVSIPHRPSRKESEKLRNGNPFLRGTGGIRFPGGSPLLQGAP